VFYFGRTDRQTDRLTYITKLIVAFRNVMTAPKTIYAQSTEYDKQVTRNINVKEV